MNSLSSVKFISNHTIDLIPVRALHAKRPEGPLVFLQKSGWCIIFDDLAFPQDHHKVIVNDGFQPMGNRKNLIIKDVNEATTDDCSTNHAITELLPNNALYLCDD